MCDGRHFPSKPVTGVKRRSQKRESPSGPRHKYRHVAQASSASPLPFILKGYSAPSGKHDRYVTPEPTARTGRGQHKISDGLCPPAD